MIKLMRSGKYLLMETMDGTKILNLDEADHYAWIKAGEIGEILVASKKEFAPNEVLAAGNYRLYEVKNEADLTDLIHLELFVGNGKWQGYLLPLGLPDGVVRRRIIPTKEIITKTTH